MMTLYDSAMEVSSRDVSLIFAIDRKLVTETLRPVERSFGSAGLGPFDWVCFVEYVELSVLNLHFL